MATPYLTGIGDEAGATLGTQIRAAKELGWSSLELRGVQVAGHSKANLHELPESVFNQCVEELEAAGVGVCCFGSTIMNWAKKVGDPFEVTLGEVSRCIPRMQRLGTRLVRIMSFKPEDAEEQLPAEVVRRVNEVVRRFLDAGLQPVHENCMNHGGMSSRHALQLLDGVPGLKWVFDTANPVFNPDRSKPKPWPQQDPWEFWQAVRDHVIHIHIKDATWNPAKRDADYNWPGEGQGRVADILRDAIGRGYSGGLSIEPHMVVVFHDAGSTASEDATFTNFVEYGRRLDALVRSVGGVPAPH